MSLKSDQFYLLMSIYDYNIQNGQQPLIHKQDNVVQVSMRTIASKLKVSAMSVSRLFKTMKEQDLMREVIDNTNTKRLMVNPSFFEMMDSKYGIWFSKAMYHAQSYNAAIIWAEMCRHDCILYDWTTFSFDCNTGEIVLNPRRPITHGEHDEWLQHAKMRYVNPDIDITDGIEADSVVSEYDIFWFAQINGDEYNNTCHKQMTRYERFNCTYKYIDSLRNKPNAQPKS